MMVSGKLYLYKYSIYKMRKKNHSYFSCVNMLLDDICIFLSIWRSPLVFAQSVYTLYRDHPHLCQFTFTYTTLQSAIKTRNGSHGLRIKHDYVEGYGNHWIAVVYVRTELGPQQRTRKVWNTKFCEHVFIWNRDPVSTETFENYST